MNYAFRLSVEAAVVGLLVVVAASLTGWAVNKFMKPTIPDDCECAKGWNRDRRMEIALFTAGAALHLVLEFAGVNAWYCKNATSWPLPW